MEKEIFDLFDLQQKLKKGIECLFPKRIWIRAEVSAVKARNGGHCYLELSQSGDDGLLAKSNAVIWSSKYRFIAPYFESVTGSPISPGMVVLVEVQVSYSELYGLSLVISDIDPDYSVGVRELERQKTIARLQAEGLMDLQSSLALPALPYRLAVVSAEDAAGYRDFMRHLHENPYGFRFETTLFPALMQGAGCPASIIAAMDAVMEDDGTYDAVLILRGGGAKLDLACFDDYGLAAVIAQFPLPVLTAIGHDQDHHVADMVAYEYVKTPTALADFFLSIYEDEDARLSSYMTRVRVAFNNRLALMESALNVLQARIKGADPRRILERGYTLALDGDGRVMKGADGRRKGDKVSVMFADGTLKCTVEEIATSLRSSQ
ncbi:MAG: exodeoxyribonuclease VII large subunit [Bacteroidales bacterium]|nr:exodeoxyribonuclease VII large subunit [Bacteroidales bacterium]